MNIDERYSLEAAIVPNRNGVLGPPYENFKTFFKDCGQTQYMIGYYIFDKVLGHSEDWRVFTRAEDAMHEYFDNICKGAYIVKWEWDNILSRSAITDTDSMVNVVWTTVIQNRNNVS